MSATTTDQALADWKGAVLTAVVRHDFPYWAISRVLGRPFMRLMGASDAVIAGLSAEQREWAEDVIDYMNPASLRTAGVIFDNQAKPWCD